jgi:nickel transport protein
VKDAPNYKVTTEDPSYLAQIERILMTNTVLWDRKELKALLLAVAFITILFVSVSPVSAHKVKVFAYVEGEKVIVEGYFGGKVKAQNCKVEVYDLDGNKIQTGKTDSNGIAEFALKEFAGAKGDLTFILEAGEGHRAEYILKASELPQNEAAKHPVDTGVGEPIKSKQDDKPVLGRANLVNRDELTKAVQAAVHKEIEPLIKMIGNQQRLLLELQDKGPSLESVVGGIGWILGIVGIVAYGLSSRKRPGN